MSSRRTRKRQRENDDEFGIEEYERAPRARTKEIDETTIDRLPTKTGDIVTRVKGSRLVNQEEESDNEEENQQIPAKQEITGTEKEKRIKRKEQNSEQEEKEKKHLLNQLTPAQRKQRIARRKIEMAQLCQDLTVDPEKNVRDNGRKRTPLRQLHDFCMDPDYIVRKYAMMSQLQVFRSILPSYKIRLPTQEEMAVKVKADLKKLWQFERSLLVGYQLYVKYLTKSLEFLKDHDKVKNALGRCAVTCLCDLMSRYSNFNEHDKIVAVVIPLLNTRFKDVVIEVTKSISSIFQSDITGECTVEIVKRISKIMKGKRANSVRPEVIDCLLDLPMKYTVDELFSKQFVREKVRRQRKMDEAEKEVAENLKLANAHADEDLRKKNHKHIIEDIFYIYLRILKGEELSKLFPSVLKGLSQFSHYIHIDICVDLVNVLANLIDEETLSVKSQFGAIMCVAKILSGPGKALQFNDDVFIMALYRSLWKLKLPNNFQHIPSALECIHEFLMIRREFSMNRVAAYAKRVLQLALQTRADYAIGLVACASALFRRYTQLEGLLGSPEDRVTSGVYQPDCVDPEHAEALSTVAWELTALTKHYHPMVAKFAEATIQCKLPPLNALPVHLVDEYNEDEGGFNPIVPLPNMEKIAASASRPVKKLFSAAAKELIDDMPEVEWA